MGSVCPDHTSPPADPLREPRKLGRYDGEGEVPPEFFDPLPDDMLDAIEAPLFNPDGSRYEADD